MAMDVRMQVRKRLMNTGEHPVDVVLISISLIRRHMNRSIYNGQEALLKWLLLLPKLRMRIMTFLLSNMKGFMARALQLLETKR